MRCLTKSLEEENLFLKGSFSLSMVHTLNNKQETSIKRTTCVAVAVAAQVVQVMVVVQALNYQ